MEQESKKPKAKVKLPLIKEIILDFVIKVDGVETDKLIMRRPTVQNRLDAEAQVGTELKVETIMIANLCDIDHAAIDLMMWSDYLKCQNAMRDLMGFTPL